MGTQPQHLSLPVISYFLFLSLSISLPLFNFYLFFFISLSIFSLFVTLLLYPSRNFSPHSFLFIPSVTFILCTLYLLSYGFILLFVSVTLSVPLSLSQTLFSILLPLFFNIPQPISHPSFSLYLSLSLCRSIHNSFR